ncbi:N-terminal delta endotoxin domain-containing protein [Dictyostelium discoideum AX4]|uniref:N-terminal delta endotoxin domain-containing protein n=1 Tax=Dictyostelium discoideum TaxID=44689 RepID=Q54H34_DICDI|nr:N-terminal delta endotoxin domain-containing protein [Dictyostelium discoideum AX4]EAL62577.2 N-terminal delta endotoxin domain-containing protein [Dictyostelium discoideum AX4]|eukprot:XP_636084.2 N-terminal delta endotoxin domain-containing protein [Dictyostelium discoideum AX4]
MAEVSFKESDILKKYKETHKAGYDEIIEKPKAVVFFDFIKDFGVIVGGIIGSIPIIGSGASAVFNVLYDHFAVDPSSGEVIRFVTPEEFESRLNSFRRQMEDFVNQKLDQTYVSIANSHHRALQKILNRYHELIVTFENNFGVPISSLGQYGINVKNYKNFKPSEDIPEGKEELQQMIRSQYLDVMNKIDECIEFFTGGSREQNLLLRGNYVITILWFITLQRDVYAIGERWDFPPQLRDQVKDSISVKIDECYKHLTTVTDRDQFRADTDYDNKDLLRIYSRFTFLDLNLYKENFHRPVLNRDTKVVEIGSKYDNFPLYLVNHGVLDMRLPPYEIDHPAENLGFAVYDFINDGVLWLNFSLLLDFGYKVSRPTRSFKKVTMEIRINDYENPNDFSVTVDSTTKASKDMEKLTFRSFAQYRLFVEQDFGRVYKCTFDFSQEKTSFDVSFQSLEPYMNQLNCVHYRLE